MKNLENSNCVEIISIEEQLGERIFSSSKKIQLQVLRTPFVFLSSIERPEFLDI